MASTRATPVMVDVAIFEHLQAKIDEDSQVREEIRHAVQTLERQERATMSILSRAHSIPQAELDETIRDAWNSVARQVETIGKLRLASSNHPYYKYNALWTREMQSTSLAVMLCTWLGDEGKLPTIEEVGLHLGVPVNLKEQDDFHLTIEEYLHALISLIEELARLAVTSVTLGDYNRPFKISKFVKDLHAGFQILNLKNDSLRRRSDSIKYNVKKIEDVVYDLSLRNLVPRGTVAA